MLAANGADVNKVRRINSGLSAQRPHAHNAWSGRAARHLQTADLPRAHTDGDPCAHTLQVTAEDGSSPVFAAAYPGRLRVLQSLAQNGANLAVVKSEDETNAVFAAAYNGHTEVRLGFAEPAVYRGGRVSCVLLRTSRAHVWRSRPHYL